MQDARQRNLLSLHHVKDSIQTFFKPRPGQNREFLWVLVAMFLLFITPKLGEGVVSYLYTYTVYHWEVGKYSQYRAVTSIVNLFGMTICIPLLNKLNINEAYILVGVFTSGLAKSIIKGLASVGWMYYLGEQNRQY